MFEDERVSMNFMGIDMSKYTVISFTAGILSEDPNNTTRAGRIARQYAKYNRSSWGDEELPMKRSGYDRLRRLLTVKYSTGSESGKDNDKVREGLISHLHEVRKARVRCCYSLLLLLFWISYHFSSISFHLFIS